MKIAVVVASKGRPDELGALAQWLPRQSRKPDQILFSVTGTDDLPENDVTEFGVEVSFGKAGLPSQRNTGIEKVLTSSDIIAFFDDDYFPEAVALEEIEKFFIANPDVAGINGTLLDDGINGPGIAIDSALQTIKTFEQTDHSKERQTFSPLMALYGCNMVFRSSAIGSVRFDEKLPLYAWQEDIDFCGQLANEGAKFMKTNVFYGVHCGVKRSRSSGMKLGYSQIANPVYLVRKGTMPGNFARSIMVRNFLANHIKTLNPEPWVDRKGRVAGNWKALFDLVTGKISPLRILELE
jgi:GT2 family glycosyltransferase